MASGDRRRAARGALDLEVRSRDLRVPAARTDDPLGYLSDFGARGLSTLVIADPARPIGWTHPEVRAACNVGRGDCGQDARLLRSHHRSADGAAGILDRDGDRLGKVNNYSEEVTVRFGTNGRVTSSEVTWSSEPAYVSAKRYGAHNTLMELRPGGELFLARWS